VNAFGGVNALNLEPFSPLRRTGVGVSRCIGHCVAFLLVSNLFDVL
jgi:hypothetical protein